MNRRETGSPLIILGCGYTGRSVLRLAVERGIEVWATSRNPERQLAGIPTSRRLAFDLTQTNTWEVLPDGADVLWCFPAAPVAAVRQWAERQRERFGCLVVHGSTSAYDLPSHVPAHPPPWIDESAPIDSAKPRVQGEEYLRERHGAILLRVAGIYGPGRNPIDWMRQDKVRPSDQYVNLVHVEDLAEICLQALHRAKPGEAYNVSDGTPRTWKEIYEKAVQPRGITAPAPEADSRTGKRISTTKLRETFGPVIRRPDLYAELARIQTT